MWEMNNQKQNNNQESSKICDIIDRIRAIKTDCVISASLNSSCSFVYPVEIIQEYDKAIDEILDIIKITPKQKELFWRLAASVDSSDFIED